MKNRNKLYAAALVISALSFAVCMGLYLRDIAADAEISGYDTAGYFLGVAAFAAADITAAAACLAGKMKKQSIVYSVSRLFIVIYCMNFTDRYRIMLVPLIISVLMYAISLLKDFRAFASRNTKAGTEVENEQ